MSLLPYYGYKHSHLPAASTVKLYPVVIIFKNCVVHLHVINTKSNMVEGVICLRMQEVLEQPGAKDRHRALREPPLWPPYVVGLAERVGVASPHEGGAAAHEPEVGHVFLAEAVFPGGHLAGVAQLALYRALEVLEMLRHRPESDGGKGGRVAQPGDGFERGDHGLELLVVLPVPLANLQDCCGCVRS